MKIVFLASGNGYGHLRRVCEVVKHIFQEDQHAHVSVLGASAHAAMIKKWGFSEQFEKAHFTFFNAHLERHLLAQLPADYTFARYKNSLQEAQEQIRIIHPNVIVSDNLVGVLDYFPNALLMGSFLFSDTLKQRFPESELIKQICGYENDILSKRRPVMLGVEEMVMPNVKTTTSFKGLPWFCTRESQPASSDKNTKNILVTGGGTSLASRRLLLLAQEIGKQADYRVSLDSSLYALLDDQEQSGFTLFDFSAEHFKQLDWIVCRPGIGILTEAVRYTIPVCAVDDEDPEISHNAGRMEELGLGVRLATDALRTPLEKNTDHFKRNLSQRSTGGALQAARYILTC